MTDQQLDLEAFSREARGAGHRLPILDAGDPTTTPASPPVWAEEGLPAEWWRFHADHPEVGQALERLARRLLRRGHTRLAVAMLWETLRYETLLGSRPDEPGPRLNNNHRAYYARWLMEQNLDLAGVFELRTSEAEKDAPPCSDTEIARLARGADHPTSWTRHREVLLGAPPRDTVERVARPPDALTVACPICGAEPGRDCTRQRLTAEKVLVRESTRPHQARTNALAELRRQTGTIRGAPDAPR